MFSGTILRTVLASELADFRKLVQRVYDTMTQDVSDVLTNEHLQLSEVSKEKHTLYSDRISRAVDEVYDICPDFDLNEYYTNPDYLNKLFPLEDEVRKVLLVLRITQHFIVKKFYVTISKLILQSVIQQLKYVLNFQKQKINCKVIAGNFNYLFMLCVVQYYKYLLLLLMWLMLNYELHMISMCFFVIFR